MFYARLWAGFVGLVLLALGIWVGTLTEFSLTHILHTGGTGLTVVLPLAGIMALYAAVSGE